MNNTNKMCLECKHSIIVDNGDIGDCVCDVEREWIGSVDAPACDAFEEWSEYE